MRPIHSAVVPLALALALLAGCNAERTAESGVDAAIPASGDARMDGYGALDFGLTAEEARTEWTGNPLEPAAPPADATACHHLSPAGQPTPAHLAFMFEDDLFVRYSVESSDITAPGGGRVGMDRAALDGLYGKRLAAMPHKYVEGGTVLASPPDGGALPTRLVFELDPAGRVTSWRVGLSPQVDYVEGCG